MFSVVIPVHNMVDTIGMCLDSLLRLTIGRDKVEIIVVDNMSTDGTLDVIRKYPFRIMEERAIQGAYAARNTALRAATGEFIAFTDADCVVDPDWLTEIAKHVGEAEFGCFAGEILSYEPGSTIERFSENIGLLRQRGPLSGWHHKPYAQTANAVYRKSVFDRIGLFHTDMKSGGDADIAWRMADQLKLKIKFVPEAQVLHRHRVDLSELYKQFRRYGTGKVSWALRHSDYRLPAPSKVEADMLKAFGQAIDRLKRAEASEEALVFPVLRAITEAAHYVGYLQELGKHVGRVAGQDEMAGFALANAPRCDVCGGLAFQPGPGNRVRDGRPPQCSSCGSLERHRTLAKVLTRLPAGRLKETRALLVGGSTHGPWPIFPELVTLSALAPDARLGRHDFDWVIANAVLRFADDDRMALRVLASSCKPEGVLVISSGEPVRQLKTVELERRGPRDPYRTYGTELGVILARTFPYMSVLGITSTDDATGVVDTLYVLTAVEETLADIDRTLREKPGVSTYLVA
ncbi:glycosyltransferase [Falsiroseomonas sp. E2-1-a20]|uniref:glycosyltransferase n=1 Tax=Falsiroseomonas sp. E2-1-a20 TaxID=3239300 RepID=UPI003F33D5CE